MLWKKDRLKATQPYFVLDTKEFFQEVYLRQGISHFYTFKVDDVECLRVVPDGCIDLFFEYDETGMHGFVCGTTLTYACQTWRGKKDVFGLRFLPGVQPAFLNVTMRGVLNQRIPIEDVIDGDKRWLEKLAKETDFYQRIRIFIEAYTKAEKHREVAYGKQIIVKAVKQMIYDSDGKIRVAKIQEESGYSERYINKIFLEEMGFSAKTFCKIIQFQRSLEFLNYGAPDKMADAAVYLGYYDQSQFIRDFTKYAGLTPKKYLDLIVRKKYTAKIRDLGELE